jgi:SAM-dependent methyltransferase
MKLKNLFFFLKRTPFHPQWHSFRDEIKLMNNIGETAHGTLIDIGCANQRLKSYIPRNCNYIALDYYKTASSLYEAIPDIYGNAQSLPFINDCAETLTLIEVIEHLPNPSAAIAEAYRVLKVGGELIITVPFLYPIHDAPYDFQRWTRFGLEALASQNNFEVREQHYRGQPAETAALLTNIAATKMTLNMLSRYNPAGLIAALSLTVFIPFTNTIGWLLALLSCKDEFMPFGYFIKLRKN